MAQRIRAFDWAATPLGHPLDWPQSLRSAVSICLNSGIASALYWGPDFRLIYNDAWSAIPGPRHPSALGRPGAEIWHDIWHVLEPQLLSARNGKGVVTRDQYLPMRRSGYLEETYWDYTFTPIAGEDGTVVGILNQGWETSQNVFAERRQRLLLSLSDRARNLETPGAIAAAATQLIKDHMAIDTIVYLETVPDSPTSRIEASWESGAPLPGAKVKSLKDLGGEIFDTLRTNHYLVIRDLEKPDIQTARHPWLEGQGSLAAIPVLRDDRLTAILLARHGQPQEWSMPKLDLLRSVAHRLSNELGRSRTEMALRESERRLRLIFEQAQDIILTADLDQIISACNPAAAAAVGVPADRVIGRSIADFLAPGEFERTSKMLQAKLADGGTTRYEVAIKTASGEIRQWDVNSALTIDVDGRPIGLHAVARDITEKRAFDEQQQLLIDELNHRVKNTLALVQGLALQSFKGRRSLEEGQIAFQSRLSMLAAGHDLLTRAKWKGASFHHLIADATAAYRDAPDRIATAGPPFELAPKQAISVVLALHELVTNAAKYGALSASEGKIFVSWDLNGRHLDLEWREQGGPPVVATPRRGFGLKMLERALANDLSGSANVEFAPSGLVCRISATLPETS